MSQVGYKLPAFGLPGIPVKMQIPWIPQTVLGECMCVGGHCRVVQGTFLGIEES